jgi:hypothetical protein
LKLLPPLLLVGDGGRGAAEKRLIVGDADPDEGNGDA